MKKIFNECNLYTVLWGYYFFHKTMTAESSTFSRLALLFVLLLSVYNLFHCYRRYRLPSVLNALMLIIGIYTIYGVLYIALGQYSELSGVIVDKSDYLKRIYISVLPVFSYYRYSREGFVSEGWLRIWSIVFVSIVTFSYFGYYMKRSGLSYEEVEDTMNRTNNTGYFFVALLPIITFWSKKKMLIHYGLLAYVVVFILICMKRGAILVGGVGVLWYMFTYTKNASNRQKLFVFILTVTVIVLAFRLVGYLLETNDFFNYRVEQTTLGDASERQILYPKLISYILNETTFFSFLFGSGADAVLREFGIMAHNDWLEIMIDQGLLGVFAFLYFWACMFKAWRQMKPVPVFYLAVGLFFITTFLRTFFSMSITEFTVYGTTVVGYCFASMDIYNIGSKNE